MITITLIKIDFGCSLIAVRNENLHLNIDFTTLNTILPNIISIRKKTASNVLYEINLLCQILYLRITISEFIHSIYVYETFVTISNGTFQRQKFIFEEDTPNSINRISPTLNNSSLDPPSKYLE